MDSEGNHPSGTEKEPSPISGNEENSLLLFKKYPKTKEASLPWSAFTWGRQMSLKRLGRCWNS
jgi:hypothetical protein